MSNVIKFPCNDNGSKGPENSTPRPIASGFFFLDVELMSNGVYRYTVDVTANNDEDLCNVIESLLVKMAGNLSPKVRITDFDTGANDDVDN